MSSSSPLFILVEVAVDPTAARGVPGLLEVPRAVAGVAVAAAVVDLVAPEAAGGKKIRNSHRMDGVTVLIGGGKDTATAKMTPSRVNTRQHSSSMMTGRVTTHT